MRFCKVGIHRALKFLALLLLCPWAWAQSPPGQGALDTVRYLPTTHELFVSGWAGSAQPNVFITSTRIDVGDATVYRGRMLPTERPDVVANTGRNDWLPSGFQVQAGLPASLPSGEQSITVWIRLSNGIEFALPAAKTTQSIQITRQPPPSKTLMLALLAAIVAPLLALFPISRIAARPQHPWITTHASALFGLTVFFSFSVLVATGTTGSSLPLLLQEARIAHSDTARWLGDLRPIRSDEWEVITPMAISQSTHTPPFPIVNRHYGADGQNMMVIGMTGVPVWHISSLAKPATWGFFLFDLRHALAWHWWFPFFACFTAVWLLLQRFFGMDWRQAAGWSASLALAPYSVGFSGWPAYTVFFPALCMVALDRMLHSQRIASGLTWGGLLGSAFTGYVLTLYPAWQITIAYLLAPLALAWLWQQRGTLRLQSAQWAGLTASLGMTALLLGSWWLDAQEAVQWIRETIYPGQRTTGTGGDIDPWFLIKGLMSPATMYGQSPMMDPSDAGSFIFLFIPTTVCTLLAWRYRRSLNVTEAALLGYTALAFLYLFMGMNASLARLSLWGMVPTYRIDIALALAQVLTIGWITHARPADALASAPPNRNLAIATGIFTAALGWYLFQKLPTLIAREIPPPLVWISCLGWGGLGYLLIVRHYGLLAFLFCLWTFATSLPFNPLVHAPTRIALDPALSSSIQESHTAPHAMTAVVGERAWSMLLPAAGVPVLNSVHYHPPRTLWKDLDPTGEHAALHNRYQRLFLRVQALSSKTAPHHIHSPRLDEVVLTLDPDRFDFNRLKVHTVIAGPADSALLSRNTSLEYASSGLGWTLFKVRPGKTP